MNQSWEERTTSGGFAVALMPSACFLTVFVCELFSLNSSQVQRGRVEEYGLACFFCSVRPNVRGESWALMLSSFLYQVWLCSEAGLDAGLEACLGVGLEKIWRWFWVPIWDSFSESSLGPFPGSIFGPGADSGKPFW